MQGNASLSAGVKNSLEESNGSLQLPVPEMEPSATDLLKGSSIVLDSLLIPVEDALTIL